MLERSKEALPPPFRSLVIASLEFDSSFVICHSSVFNGGSPNAAGTFQYEQGHNEAHLHRTSPDILRSPAPTHSALSNFHPRTAMSGTASAAPDISGSPTSPAHPASKIRSRS